MALEEVGMKPVDDDALGLRPLRLAAASVVWILCLPGCLYHVVVLGSVALVNLLSGEWLDPFDLPEVGVMLLILLSVLSWLALAWMSIAWVLDRPVHWAWPVAGTALTLPILLATKFLAALFVLPGVLLALYLCVWHLRRARRGAGNLA